MHDIEKKAEAILLGPTETHADKMEEILGLVYSSQVDFADLYLQNTVEETWSLEDGQVKDVDFSIDRGFGLRAVKQDQVGFAYADDITLPLLRNAAQAAKRIASPHDRTLVTCHAKPLGHSLYHAIDPVCSLADQDKCNLLRQMDQYARQLDPRVKQVFISLTSTYDAVMVFTSDGNRSADLRPLVHLSVRVIVEQNGRIEQGSAGGGARSDLTYFLPVGGQIEVSMAVSYVKKAVRKGLLNLDAKAVPAGEMPVVLGPGWPAVLLHEAVGHGLEADFNRKGSSVYSGRIGEQVASPLCTIVDDGTMAHARGSLNMDDEGEACQRTVLIENGVLKGYMMDRLNARLMNKSSTGNGRRESYAHCPLPRMTTTYMENGDSDPGEILASLDKGIYAVDFSGGQVDITNGQFVFSMNEAYWVENGEIQYPVKGATLVGDGATVLSAISMVGNDLAFDSGVGTCGKDGQSVPVGVGQPTLKIDQITVGGVL